MKSSIMFPPSMKVISEVDDIFNESPYIITTYEDHFLILHGNNMDTNLQSMVILNANTGKYKYLPDIPLTLFEGYEGEILGTIAERYLYVDFYDHPGHLFRFDILTLINIKDGTFYERNLSNPEW